MQLGNKAIDDKGKLSKYTTEEKDAIIKAYPAAASLFKPCYGADEYLDRRERWCLWLKGISPSVYRGIKPISDAINKVKEFRASSTRTQTQKFASTPMVFGETRQPQSEYLIVPLVNTEKRVYVPMDFFTADIVPTHQLGVIENATLYHFGVLQILEARKKYSDWKPFDLYSDLMPPELIKAHKDNDKAVMEAYGMNPQNFTEDESNSILLNMYNEIVYR